MMTTLLGRFLSACAVASILLTAGWAHATVLTFQIAGVGNGESIDGNHQDYGDNVVGAGDGAPYTYGTAGGDTPNVEVSYSADTGLVWWGSIYASAPAAYNNTGGKAEIQLTADPGYEVVLDSFTLTAWSGTPQLAGDVVASDGTTTFTDSNPIIPSGVLTTYDSTDFGTTLQGSTITISFDDVANFVAIDNVQFSQVEAVVPEPNTMILLCLTFIGALAMQRRRR